MITGELKSTIDNLWTKFWTGGITNPFTVIEQITFLMFSRMLDITEKNNERRFQAIGKTYKKIFQDNEQDIRWDSFRHLEVDKMLMVVRDRVFPHFKNAIDSNSTFAEYMKDAQLMIVKPSLLVDAVEVIDKLPLTIGDTKGDLYEYLLSKLQTSGIAGQFRTPRHIIKLMVQLVNPEPNDLICDPACGTGGFLVAAKEYLDKKYTTLGLEEKHEDGSVFYPGDQLFEFQDHINSTLLTGFDFDATMLRIAAMNLLLHGIENPQIHNQDALSGNFYEKFPEFAENYFSVILANPPFKGSLDDENVEPSLLGKVKTRKTELLFNALFLRLLKVGGRAAVIVPDGVLFGASKAHLELRKMLIDENQLDAIISLPSGVFKPYAGVSTAIIVFTKGGKTENVWFYDVENDGLSLDDKRMVIKENDLPDVYEKWIHRDNKKTLNKKNFFVSIEEIKKNNYDLSINKYKEPEYTCVEYEKPQKILGSLMKLEEEIFKEINQIKKSLKFE